MNFKYCNHCNCVSKTSFENLMQELDSVRDDITTIKRLKVSEEVKLPILKELQKQFDEVKKKMHSYIDSL